MAGSLQDQLLKAGVVDSKKARKIKQDKRKRAKQMPKGQVTENQAAVAAEAARKAKVEKDRALNRQREQEQAEKALLAQMRQIVEAHRISRAGGEAPYQFTDGKKIKKLHVTAEQVDQLSRGQIAVARLGESYELIPRNIAEKIRERHAETLVSLQERATNRKGSGTESAAEEDPYADYPIPDDLMW